jgi:hypothetical protein
MSGYFAPALPTLANAQFLAALKAAGTPSNLIGIDASDNLVVGVNQMPLFVGPVASGLRVLPSFGGAGVRIGTDGIANLLYVRANSTGVELLNTKQFSFSSDPGSVISDVGLARIAAAVLKATDGSSGYGSIDAAGYKTAGVAGVTTFGPAAVTSITVKGGIITAIS